MSTNTQQLLFRKLLTLNRIPVDEGMFERLVSFERLIREWNQRINLVSRADEERILSKHIIESLAILSRFEIPGGTAWIDVGTGGGFPGVSLAIALPGCRFTLVDSIRKKINALQDILASLALTNTTAICERAEVLSSSQTHANRYDYVIARAVAPVKDLIRWCAPFLVHGEAASGDPQGDRELLPRGTLVMLKGGDLSGELEQARIKHRPRLIRTVPVVIDGLADPEDVKDKKIVLIQP